LPFRFFARALPQLEKLIERQNGLVVVLADANIPTVGLAEVEAQRVGARRDANSNVTIAWEHSFEKVGARKVAHEPVPTGHLIRTEYFSSRGTGN
jgi:hypothetical protein